jgi:hypothetical protein
MDTILWTVVLWIAVTIIVLMAIDWLVPGHYFGEWAVATKNLLGLLVILLFLGGCAAVVGLVLYRIFG